MNWNDIFECTDGVLYWKVNRSANKTKGKGTVAGHPSLRNKGYGYVSFNRKAYPTHRIIWEMNNGKVPDGLTVDHINRNRGDNRIENLRLATKTQQAANTKKWSISKTASRWKGVCAWKRSGKWRLFVKGEYRGIFDCEEDAATTYNFYAADLYGRFAVFNEIKQDWLEARAEFESA